MSGHDRGGILLSLPTSVSEDVDVLRMHDIIRLSGYDLLFCLSTLLLSQEIDWSRYDSDDPLCFPMVLIRGRFLTFHCFTLTKITGRVSLLLLMSQAMRFPGFER